MWGSSDDDRGRDGAEQDPSKVLAMDQTVGLMDRGVYLQDQWMGDGDEADEDGDIL